MESVSQIIKGMVNKKERTPNSILNKNVRFSISLTTLQNRRLEVLTDKIDVSKQEFIQKVVEAALVELESELDLIHTKHKDLLGLVSCQYRSGYVREIVEGLGISEEEWWDIVDNSGW